MWLKICTSAACELSPKKVLQISKTWKKSWTIASTIPGWNLLSVLGLISFTVSLEWVHAIMQHATIIILKTFTFAFIWLCLRWLLVYLYLVLFTRNSNFACQFFKVYLNETAVRSQNFINITWLVSITWFFKYFRHYN